VSNTDQTGDVPHIAAAMAHDPLTDVLIVCPQGQEATRDSMADTYKNATRSSLGFDRHNLYTSLREGDSRIRTLRQDPDETYQWYQALIPKSEVYGPLGPPSWRSAKPEDEHIYTYLRGDMARLEYKMMYVG